MQNGLDGVGCRRRRRVAAKPLVTAETAAPPPPPHLGLRARYAVVRGCHMMPEAPGAVACGLWTIGRTLVQC